MKAVTDIGGWLYEVIEETCIPLFGGIRLLVNRALYREAVN